MHPLFRFAGPKQKVTHFVCGQRCYAQSVIEVTDSVAIIAK